MKTWIYRDRIDLADLRVVTRPDPEPGPRDVVIRIRAAALNYRDLAIARGNYHIGVSAPLVPLSDGAGEVVAVGSEVTRFRAGDLACPVYLPNWIDGPLELRLVRRRLGGPNDGVLSEYVKVGEEEAVRAPKHLDATEAATLPVAAVTAWHALYQAAPTRPGETVLVLGTGGVSIAALQLARVGGARVVVVTRDDRHATRLMELGASAVIPRGDLEDWPARVLAVSDGGADVAIDVVGGLALARTIAATRMGGRVHLVGYVADTTATIDTFDAIRHGTVIHVATAGSRRSFEALNRAIETAAVRPVVDRVFPVDAVGDAFAHLAERGRLGKVVVTIP